MYSIFKDSYLLSVISGGIGGSIYYKIIEQNYNCKIMTSIIMILWCIIIFMYTDTRLISPLIVSLISGLLVWHTIHLIYEI